MTSAQIKPLTAYTYEQWSPLWQAYLTFYETSLDEQQTKLTWSRLIDPNQTNLFGFAIEKDQQIIGFVHLTSHLSTWKAQPYCYLQDLFIDKKYRNQGFARQLIEHSYQICKPDFSQVYWLTHETNHTAQLLYDRIATKTGFIHYKKVL